MPNSVVIPQDIIDKIIEMVDDDHGSLKECTLVSSSFLLPSRKRLFSHIYLRSDQGCQRLQQFFVENPPILPSVRSITLNWGFLGFQKSRASYFQQNDTSLIAVLRRPFCCLESLSIYMWATSNWNDFSRELKDALSTIIRSSTLKTFYLRNVNVPIMLLQGTHLTELRLSSVILDGGQSRLPTLPASEGVETADQDVWIIHMWYRVRGPTEPIFFPFMCRLRVFEINFDPYSAKIRDLDILSFMIQSLRLSLTSPPTLEHLKLRITFTGHSDRFDYYSFYDDLRDADFLRHLDSFVTHPTGSRLQRVDIDIKYTFHYNNDGSERDESEVEEPILDALPLLREKGILFVEATENGCG